MYKFPVYERLKSRKQIALLFKSGRTKTAFPVLAVYRTGHERPPIQVAFTVSKRHFKKAVTRNRIKRLMREAWRLQKHALIQTLEQHNQNLRIIIIYTAKEALPFHTVKAAIRKLIQKLIAEINS